MLISLLALLAGAQAAPVPAPPLPSDAIAADWRTIPDDELMVVTLTGNWIVVIRLAPRFAPEHVANVRKLALARWWDGTSVYRVQENWVTQWGDATEKKPLAERRGGTDRDRVRHPRLRRGAAAEQERRLFYRFRRHGRWLADRDGRHGRLDAALLWHGRRGARFAAEHWQRR